VKDKAAVSSPIGQPAPVQVTDRDRLQEGYRLLLNEADEKKVREIIAGTLGLVEGTPGFETLVRYWREHRESHGWQIS